LQEPLETFRALRLDKKVHHQRRIQGQNVNNEPKIDDIDMNLLIKTHCVSRL